MPKSLFDTEDPIGAEVDGRIRELKADPEEMLRQFDRNGDGVLDAEERRAMRDVLRRQVAGEASRDDEIIDGRYRVVAPIGRGAQGHTSLAVELKTDEFVALKEVDFAGISGWDAVDTFEREAAVLGGLEHPGIPRMRESFRIEEDGELRLIMVQDFVEGDNLEVLLREGTLFDEARLRRYASELVDILVYLHQHSPPVIHRDIKPANVIERPDGSLALVDFGAAQGDQRGIAVIGTNGYMAPEQLMGRAVPASDLYALGATISHLATRKHPTEMGKGLALDWEQHARLSAEFVRWLNGCVAPMPEDRFATAMIARSAGRAVFEPPDAGVILPSTEELVEAATRDNAPKMSRSLTRARPPGCALDVREYDGKLTVYLPSLGVSNATAAILTGAASGVSLLVFFMAGGPLKALPFVLVFLAVLAAQFLRNPVEMFECSPKGITVHRARSGTVKRFPLAQIEGTSTRAYDKTEELRLHLRGSPDLTLAYSVRRPDIQWLQNVVQRYLLEQRMQGGG